MHPKNSEIEIELNENQINNTNYDVQSCNDDAHQVVTAIMETRILLLPMMRIRRRKMTKEKQ